MPAKSHLHCNVATFLNTLKTWQFRNWLAMVFFVRARSFFGRGGKKSGLLVVEVKKKPRQVPSTPLGPVVVYRKGRGFTVGSVKTHSDEPYVDPVRVQISEPRGG